VAYRTNARRLQLRGQPRIPIAFPFHSRGRRRPPETSHTQIGAEYIPINNRLYGGTPPTDALTAELMRYPRSTREDFACAI
jgi:hypothetical protein